MVTVGEPPPGSSVQHIVSFVEVIPTPQVLQNLGKIERKCLGMVTPPQPPEA